MDFFETLLFDILSTTWIEWLAVATGVLFVFFAAARYLISWFFAIVNAAIYVWLCIEYDLYIELVIQLFYLALAALGWWTWNVMYNERKKSREKGEYTTDIHLWSSGKHVLGVLLSGGTALLLGFIFEVTTHQQNPYLFALITVFGLMATYMMILKVLENWVYWILINSFSVFLYTMQGLQLTAVMHFLFTLLAVIGWIIWYRKWKKVQDHNAE